MDIFRPKKQGRKFIIVYKDSIRVLDDYIRSLELIDKVIEIDQFDGSKFLSSNDVYIFTQMWLPPTSQNKLLLNNPRFIFLNVENLTEELRNNQMKEFIKAGARVADYSQANIAIMNDFIKQQCPTYKYTPLWIPYQAHPIDFCQLFNGEREYEYDIGMVNAIVKKDDSVNSHIVYRRNLLWEKIEKLPYKSINIMGWNKERDELIRKCKIIVNVHVFDCFSIFQHIRCDRLIFANKLIVSEKSLIADQLDINGTVVFSEYDNLIDTIKSSLDYFDSIQSSLENIPKQPIKKHRQIQLQQSVDDICKHIK